MKHSIGFCCGLISLILSYSTQAIEPAADRARVIGLQADLLLPQGSIMRVEMNTDCGSAYENLAVLAMSEQGAKIIAAGLGVLYGIKMEQAAMSRWLNKSNAMAPRKPSFLLVQGLNQDGIQSDGIQSDGNQRVRVFGGCGDLSHAPR